MILPFSSSRSRTSLISNCLYCASLTPRAMFSKSMNNASFRSPFTGIYYIGRSRVDSSPHEEVVPHEAARSDGRVPCPSWTDAHREVARAHLRADAGLRPRAVELSVLRPRGARGPLDVGRVPEAPAHHRAFRHPLRHPLVEARQHVGRG